MNRDPEPGRFMRPPANPLREALPMCLGIPMQIRAIDGFNARCEAKGVERDVNLFMLQHEALEPGDFVVVHVGYAIEKITEQQAQSAWEIYDQMLAADEAGHA